MSGDRPPPLCLGHRGASSEAPENTLLAFARAFEAGADGIELDVRATRDGKAAVFHDPDLGRLSGDRRRIADLEWPELSRIRIRGEAIPRLEEALDLAAGRGVVQIELKAEAALAPTLRAIRRTGSADGIILASFGAGMVRRAGADAPRLLRMLISDPPRRVGGPEAAALALLRRMASAGAHGLSVSERAVTSVQFVETFRRRGVRLWCWTVNKPARMRELARLGIDALLTDDPGGMVRALRPGA